MGNYWTFDANGNPVPRPATELKPRHTGQISDDIDAAAHQGGRRAPGNASPGPRANAPDQQRLQNLAKDDIDHAGQTTKGTTQEAEVALGVEARGDIPVGRLRRPQPGEGIEGDFVDDLTGQRYDVKRPSSRDALEKKIAEENAEKGRPAPNLSPNKKIKGQFQLQKDLATIKKDIDSGDHVLLDTRALNEKDLAELKAAIQDPDTGIDPTKVTFWP